MSRARPGDLDFGAHEKAVRWIEDTPPGLFREGLPARLAKVKVDAFDGWVRAAALASTRSIRFEGIGRAPHGLLVLAPVRASLQGADPDSARRILAAALLTVNDEIHHPGFGPYRLQHFDEVPGQGKEGTLFGFLEAVRAGETDWADHRFAWLVRNLEKEQVIDLLLSSGLECATQGAHKVLAVVEVVALLQALGWEHGWLWLRPVVRHQASGGADRREYDLCRDLVASRDLLRLSRRRPPGQASLGESRPDAFFEQAVAWAESDPPNRMELVAAALASGIPLEDVGELLSLGATLLYLQEVLRQPDGARNEAELERRMHLATSVFALRQLVRLGTTGQRILALVLAAWAHPARGVRLNPRSPDCGWWLSPALRLLEKTGPSAAGAPATGALGSAFPDTGVAPGEGSAAAVDGGRAAGTGLVRSASAADPWAELVRAGQGNGLLPLISERLEAGLDASALEGPLSLIAADAPMHAGLAVKLARSFGDAYRTSRSPHRWMHLWAAGLGMAYWPRQLETGDLRGGGAAATIPVQG